MEAEKGGKVRERMEREPTKTSESESREGERKRERTESHYAVLKQLQS